MRNYLLIILLSSSFISVAQDFGRSDSLRGYLSAERSCYNVTYYDLDLSVDIDSKYISGFVDIYFAATADFSVMQFDLFQNMKVNSVFFEGDEMNISREYDAVFVQMDRVVRENEQSLIRVEYSGNPRVAINPPWDGGFSWRKDDNGKDWVGVSCQGLGASAWWPNKDHQSDEPDSMRIACSIADELMVVANGNLRSEKSFWSDRFQQHMVKYEWFVSNPINNYDVSLNIGDYTHFSDKYISGEDTLALDYYVLSYNEGKAKKHFEQVKPMLRCFEEYLGPYPFWEDGYALVETPYLGMEHQSAIAYGNDYLPGYKGNQRFIAGLDFDFIIVHESGHEWWGNSVTANDIADMWIQEAFCTYAEVMYVECMYGYDTMIKYVENQMTMIRNDKPIVGVHHVHHKGSGDMYQKGSSVLHTLRSLIEDDELWFDIIKSMTAYFRHQTIDGREVLDYINEKSGYDFNDLYEQYLYSTDLPEFQYRIKEKEGKELLEYRWEANEKFDMPIMVSLRKNAFDWIYPSKEWREVELEVEPKDFKVALNLFLMDVKKLK